MTLYIFYPFFIILFGATLYYFSKKIGLVDKPNERKLHQGEIPVIGGLVGGVSLLIFSFFLLDSYDLFFIIICSFLILLIGVIDDLFDIHFAYRLILQSIIILIVIDYGIVVRDLGNFEYFGNLNLGYLGILLTYVSILGLTNAINFIDGSDGICASVLIISFISIIVFSLLFSSLIIWEFFFLILIYLVLFLYFNFFSKNFKIFLGDSGSTFFGFLMSLSLIYFTKKDIGYFDPSLVIWCVALPIYDLLSVILKRIFNKKNPFLPDRTHIHHFLILRNYSKLNIFMTLSLLQIIFLFIGILSYNLLNKDITLLNYILCFFIYFIFKNKILENKKST